MQIKPVSDLRNYKSVLDDVSVGNPVYLTKNGYGKYVIYDIAEAEEIERSRAMSQLLFELQKGRESGEKEGYLTLEEAKERFGLK